MIEIDNDNELLKEVFDIFTNYLSTHKYRRTPERFSILEEIYTYNKHFDAEQLYLRMKNKNFNVSKATVYNTLEVLSECNLVVKHQFGENHAQYEKAYNSRQHDHLICSTCGQVIEFCDPRIQQIKESVGKLLHQEIKQHSLTLYGKCLQDNCDRLDNNNENS